MNGPAASDSVKRPAPRSSFWLPGAVLLLITGLALAVQGAMPKPSENRRASPLREYFPPSMNGWEGTDLPLAQTESAVDKAEKILQLDEFINRTYRKGGLEFNVYVAYWSPGKIPSREVAFHIPDKCWVAAGWTRTKATYDHVLSIADHTFAPAQLREFYSNATLQHVVYWHIFNGETIVYNRDGSPSDLSMLTDLLKLGFNLRGEQYFIRISSKTPLSELEDDDGFVQVMELVADLGPGKSSTIRQF